MLRKLKAFIQNTGRKKLVLINMYYFFFFFISTESGRLPSELLDTSSSLLWHPPVKAFPVVLKRGSKKPKTAKRGKGGSTADSTDYSSSASSKVGGKKKNVKINEKMKPSKAKKTSTEVN